MGTPSHSAPWRQSYAPEFRDFHYEPRFATALAMFDAAVQEQPSAPALCYFDGALSYRELDVLSDEMAQVLHDCGVGPGERVALFLQNVPQFVIAMIATWKLGGIVVTINPMNRERELHILLGDCQPRVLLSHAGLYADPVAKVLPEVTNLQVITTSEAEFQTRNDRRVLPAPVAPPAPERDLATLMRHYRGKAPRARAALRGEDLASMVYTSGTTGIPKGALHTHHNYAFNCDLYRSFIKMRDGGPVLGIAPLFHITGLIGHIGAAFACKAPLILAYRFHPEVMAEACAEHRAEFTIGAITAFISMMNTPGITREHLCSLTQIYSGGAPIPISVVQQFQDKFGHYIRNAYGLTESTSPLTFTPHDAESPFDAENGSLSVGVPVFETDLYIADDEGKPLAVGEVGEIMGRGPQVVQGYWQRPDATREAFYEGYLRTGDVGYMNGDGYFFIVDRKKDMINSSGYKVWPREVEEVLYTHPAVLEAAVVGVKDEYRGETVKAVVSLKRGKQATPAELIEFCKERMAAYKYPRQVEIRDDLPKTATGKILRRELRG